jgi:hypothetical protein
MTQKRSILDDFRGTRTGMTPPHPTDLLRTLNALEKRWLKLWRSVLKGNTKETLKKGNHATFLLKNIG